MLVEVSHDDYWYSIIFLKHILGYPIKVPNNLWGLFRFCGWYITSDTVKKIFALGSDLIRNVFFDEFHIFSINNRVVKLDNSVFTIWLRLNRFKVIRLKQLFVLGFGYSNDIATVLLTLNPVHYFLSFTICFFS